MERLRPGLPVAAAPCEVVLPNPMENKIFLAHYRLSLGRNGLPVELHRTPRGVTYRAQKIDSGREVAIELIPWTSADAEATARLHAEAEAAKEINQINIPVLYDFGIEDDQLIYVTDYFDGHSAEAWVAARGPLPLRAVLRIAMQVSAALGAASFRRIHHRALNPANIIFVPGQTAEGDWPAIKVLHWLGPAPDFSATESTGARNDAAVRFASPEQRRGEEVDFAATVYSLGCTMWFLLTGAPPAATPAASSGKTMRARVEKLRGVPKIVRHLLGRMLRRNPAERPHDPVVLEAFLQTCLARIERREAVSQRLGLPVAAQARAVAARQWSAKSPWVVAALLLLLAGILAVAGPRFWHSRTRRVAMVSAVAASPAVVRQVPSSTPAAIASTARLTTKAPLNTSTEHATNSPGAVSDTVAIPQAAPTSLADGTRITATPAPLTTPAKAIAEASAPAERPAEIASPTQSAPQVSPAPTAATIAANESAAHAPSAISDKVAIPRPTETPAALAEIPNTPHHAIAFHASPPSKKEAAEEVAARSHEKIAKKTTRQSKHASRRHIAHATVRRGVKIPRLRVGSSPAELVGTTPDGRWILSVASSGRRIIVPPPPGFGP